MSIKDSSFFCGCCSCWVDWGVSGILAITLCSSSTPPISSFCFFFFLLLFFFFLSFFFSLKCQSKTLLSFVVVVLVGLIGVSLAFLPSPFVLPHPHQDLLLLLHGENG
eukprot:TRINITY_DN8766_c0_g1_i1.p1 TRINITY_DN8766_c0_g1~~TRINITY_DN8766_c0_g1_i1.p1  ORF type:complete len:108 (+),score=32.74 TRINITY_DN8766_c0_g1_i1:1-324(+)